MIKNKQTILATICSLIAQVIFGFSFMFTKIALDFASPLTIIADRYIVAFLGLTVALLFTKTKIRFNKNIWKLILMAVFQPFLYFIFESYGIKLTTSAFSSIMISLIPVVAMVSGIFILKEVPSILQYVFTLLSIGGVVVMALAGNADGTVTLGGILLLLGAVLSAVGYNIMSRKISSEFTPFERTYAMSVIGLISFLTIALIENIKAPTQIFTPFLNPAYLWSILYLGLASSVVAFFLLNYANTHLPIAKTTVFSNVTTVVSVMAGIIFLNEKLSFEVVISTVMIVVGVCGVQLLAVKNKK